MMSRTNDKVEQPAAQLLGFSLFTLLVYNLYALAFGTSVGPCGVDGGVSPMLVFKDAVVLVLAPVAINLRHWRQPAFWRALYIPVIAFAVHTIVRAVCLL